MNKNVTTEERKVKLLIKSGYGPQTEVEITQSAFEWDVTPTALTCGALDESPIAISINKSSSPSEKWEHEIVEGSSNVASVEKTSSGYSVVMNKNVTTEERKVKLLIKSGYGPQTEVEITQSAFEWSVTYENVDTNGETFNIVTTGDAGSLTFNVVCSNSKWTIQPQDTDLIECKKSSDGSSFKLWAKKTVTENTSSNVIVSSGLGHNVQFTVVVKASLLDFSL